MCKKTSLNMYNIKIITYNKSFKFKVKYKNDDDKFLRSKK